MHGTNIILLTDILSPTHSTVQQTQNTPIAANQQTERISIYLVRFSFKYSLKISDFFHFQITLILRVHRFAATEKAIN